MRPGGDHAWPGMRQAHGFARRAFHAEGGHIELEPTRLRQAHEKRQRKQREENGKAGDFAGDPKRVLHRGRIPRSRASNTACERLFTQSLR